MLDRGISGRAKTFAAQRGGGAQRRGGRAVGIFPASAQRGRPAGDSKNRRGRLSRRVQIFDLAAANVNWRTCFALAIPAVSQRRLRTTGSGRERCG